MSLDGTYDSGNVFAKILRGELPCHKVFEDDVALAFLDLFPQVNGHTLVVPKVASRNFLDFPGSELGPYMQRVQIIARAVREAFQPDGVRLVQFNGAPAGQTIFHLHFHILPIFEGAAERGHAGPQRADDQVLIENAAKIRKALA